MRTIIVIPFHCSKMKPEEECSLRQCARIYSGKRDIAFVIPESLDCSAYTAIIPDAVIRRFPDSFFTSVSGYNHLLLTPGFYECFDSYDYMFVYQLDGWVFKDELDFWCLKGYDYVGGPFFMKDGFADFPVVGNGGVSLRKIKAMLRVLNGTEQKMFPNKLLWRFVRNYFAERKYFCCLRPLLKMIGLLPNLRGNYLARIRREKFNSEDVVFYYLSKEFTSDGLNMPGLDEAVRFSLDAAPREFFAELPFCCHAWLRNDFEFWKKYIDFK